MEFSTQNMADSPMNDENVSLLKPSIQIVESSITKKLSALPTDPGKSYTVCIYRVSGKYRKVNEEAYSPRLVSIGPLHHGKSELQAMEAYKLSCLRSFADKNQVTIKELIEFVAKEESYVRGCYEDTMTFTPNLFTEIILLDGVFVVELFLKNHSLQLRGRSDAIYENRWMQKDVLHDMLLLENQLPISFLQGLFTFVKFEPRRELKFYDLVREYFKDVGNTGKLLLQMGNTGRPSEPTYWTEARHLVEFLVYLHWPSKSNAEMKPLPIRKFEYTRSAAELEEAGVKFKHGNESCLFQVSFDEGELKIPPLTVNDNTETFFRNSIAFEQCGYYGKNITSYVILMDSLINTGKDVDLLVKYGIIENLLGESEKVADLFNNLYKEVVANEKDFYFAEICDKLNKYSKDKWHKWKSTRFRWNQMLKRDYFGNPWSSISVTAASILLGLTITQTVCSLLSV